jgi:Binding-protein-dependent transport system inner membrane component
MSTQAETVLLPPRIRRRRAAIRLGDLPVIPTLILVVIALIAIFANVLAPHNPEVGSLVARFKPPFWQTGGSTKYLLGTDQLGRDVLSRLMFGARVSMVVGFTAVIFAGVIGTALGILSGYLGGWVDQVIMRLTDTWLALPALTFAIFLAAIVGPSMWNIVIILGITYWTRYARVIRGEVLSLKEREFVRLAIVAFGHRTRQSDAGGGHHHRGDVVVPRRRRAAAAAGLGADAFGRQAGPDGRPLVADHIPRLLHYADGALGKSSRRLAPCQIRPTAPSAMRRPGRACR